MSCAAQAQFEIFCKSMKQSIFCYKFLIQWTTFNWSFSRPDYANWQILSFWLNMISFDFNEKIIYSSRTSSFPSFSLKSLKNRMYSNWYKINISPWPEIRARLLLLGISLRLLFEFFVQSIDYSKLLITEIWLEGDLYHKGVICSKIYEESPCNFGTNRLQPLKFSPKLFETGIIPKFSE